MRAPWKAALGSAAVCAWACLALGAAAQPIPSVHGTRPAAKAAAKESGPVGGQEMSERIAEGVVDRFFDAVDAHWHKGEYNHVINIYRDVIAAEPYNMDAYSNAGWLLWSMDRDAEALALYNQGARANPTTFYLYDEIGMYYANRKHDWAAALPYYVKAAAQKDCPATTVHMLAHAYERTGHLDRAVQTWERAIAMKDNPNRPAAQTNLQRVRKLLAERAGGR